MKSNQLTYAICKIVLNALSYTCLR